MTGTAKKVKRKKRRKKRDLWKEEHQGRKTKLREKGWKNLNKGKLIK